MLNFKESAEMRNYGEIVESVNNDPWKKEQKPCILSSAPSNSLSKQIF